MDAINEEKAIDNNVQPAKSISDMTNDEIGAELDQYLLKNDTNGFKSFIQQCKLLESQASNLSKDPKDRLSLNYVLNVKLYGEYQDPMIVNATWKNNIEIIQALLDCGVCYLISTHFCYIIFCYI